MSTAKNDLPNIYEMLAVMPGMNDTVKIEIRVTRKLAFLLSKVIEKGLDFRDNENIQSLMNAFDAQPVEDLKNLPDEILRKAGLIELNEKLKNIG